MKPAVVVMKDDFDSVDRAVAWICIGTRQEPAADRKCPNTYLGSVAKLSAGIGARPDILQECENHGHPCSNGDTSNPR